MIELAYLIPFYSLAGFAIIVFFTRWNEKLSSALSCTLSTVGLIHSIMVLIEMIGRHGEAYQAAITFINHPAMKLELGMWIDPLTAVMLCVVTIVATCVQFYSIGYMHGDPRYSRFFSYLSLFAFSMLGLVIANNFFMIFCFWELVGLSSYLLIGFWFEKKSAADAGKKAFITNRVGDFGFIIGLMILITYAGTLNYQEVFAKVTSGQLDPNIIALAGVFVFCGAIGKSAQFPLHVWLPDAMEGPTPVSALIHAATMVAAGVYLVARGMTLFAASETASMVIAVIGLVTSFMAASIAITQIDFKRVLAFSTCSQLGYMVMALGLYGVDFARALQLHHGDMSHFHSPGFYAGTFHLMTHAFFKALLFLGAGSVIHAVHTNDIMEMGGLRKKMPTTAWTFMFGCLAISGIFPFAGFFSKDEIVAATTGHPYFKFFTLVIAFMTAFYMFRLYILSFEGKPRDEHRFEHAHESPKTMTIPLMVLAFLALTAGWVGWPWWEHGFASFVYHNEPYHVHPNYLLMLTSLVVASLGIFSAYFVYHKKGVDRDAIADKIRWLYNASYNKFYWDEIYGAVIINPTLAFTNMLWWFDANIIDGLVNGTAWLMVKWSDIKQWFDKYIIDGMVNGAGYICQAGSWLLKYIQTGSVQFYTLVVIGAVVGFILYKVIGIWVLIYVIALIVAGLAQVVINMARPQTAESEPNIDEV